MAKKFGDLFGNMDDVFSGAKISNFDLDDMLSRTRTFTEEVSKRSADTADWRMKRCSNLSCSRRRLWKAVGRRSPLCVPSWIS